MPKLEGQMHPKKKMKIGKFWLRSMHMQDEKKQDVSHEPKLHVKGQAMDDMDLNLFKRGEKRRISRKKSDHARYYY